MKKTIISLATASLIASSAMAADKGIDLTTTGQAVVYYETHTDNKVTNADSIFGKAASAANVGIQLNIGGDLGNGFILGSQLSYIGTAGLEKNLVNSTKQTGAANTNTSDELALSKIFIAKKIANTTVKLGRQELPKSLSPLAFTEGWNVFKNTFDAIVAINSDIKDTTLVGAYVSASNSTVGTGLSQMTDLKVGGPTGYAVTKGAYMLTAANKSLPMTAITASFYKMNGIKVVNVGDNSATAIWFDAKVADKSLPMGLNVGVQFGSIMPDLADAPAAEDTTAFGIKVGVKPMSNLAVSLAFTSVNDGTVAVKNVGTGIKTPLYTQMVYNQNAIAKDNDTIVAKAVFKPGMGKIVAQYGMTTDNSAAGNDYTEFDLLYIVKAGNVKYFAGLMSVTADTAGAANIIGSPADADNKVRVWARYAF